MMLFLFACAPTEDSGTEPSACEQLFEGTGEAVGTRDCSSDVCQIEGGLTWLGEADPTHPERCPARQVTVATFAIDAHEVTLESYDACVTAGACSSVEERCSLDPLRPSDHPATCVSFEDAASLCAWKGGRLPTEAEWERAARGSDGALYPWGREGATCERANFHFSVAYCEQGPLPVGSYAEPSAFGLYDTFGNVWEWTASFFDADQLGDGLCSDVVGGDRGVCQRVTLKGGAYNSTDEVARASGRIPAAPDTRDINIGLRCAYDP